MRSPGHPTDRFRRVPIAFLAAVAMSLLGLALMAGAILSAGCASPGQKETGVRVGDETLKQFEAGVTTEGWLVAILGRPTSAAPVAGVENTFVYRYATGAESSGLATLVSGQSSHTSSVVYFVITDGIVTRYWADRAEESTLLGGKSDKPSGDKLEDEEED